MKKPGDVVSKLKELNDLEKKFNEGEDRFNEVRQFLGKILSEGIYVSFVGFDRTILYFLLKLILPVAFAAILAYIDTVWIVVIVPGLFFVYFCAQLFYIRAKTSSSDWVTFFIFIMISYTSGV